MRLLRNISRYIIALVFIFSGLVKAVDPLGSTYKFIDYFYAFNLDWLEPSALFFSVLLSAIEFAIGFALLSNALTRLSSIVMFVFMSFFTILTFTLAIYNPVSDCGCFGDAIKLTNWQTFYKNLIFMIPAIFVFWQRKHYRPRFGRNAQIFIVIIGLLSSAYMSYYSYRHLPFIDFRSYTVGTNIQLAMKNHWDGAPEPVFETSVVYEKDGVKKTYATHELPDSTWTWIETNSKQIDKGYEASIYNFNISDENKNDITDQILHYEGFTLMVVAYDLEQVPAKTIARLKMLSDVSQANGYQFFILTASNQDEVQEFSRKYVFSSTFYYADPITLKTVVRSTPGLVLMHRSTILNKWHYNDFPKENELSEYALFESSLNQNRAIIKNHLLGLMFFWILIIALIEVMGLKNRFT